MEKFWHIQMSQGLLDGVDKTVNEVIVILKKDELIGTGEWTDKRNNQCNAFKNTLQIGDIVMVRAGKNPIALVKVSGENIPNNIYGNSRKVQLLSFYTDLSSQLGIYSNAQTRGTLEVVSNVNTNTAKFIFKWYNLINKNMETQKIAKILKRKNQIILQGPPGTGKTYMAKNIAEEMITGTVSPDKNNQKDNLNNSDRFQLIQFHPSYTYEDFVRGITAKANGTSISYQAENKILANFAKTANQNYINSKKQPDELSIDNWINQQFQLVIQSLQTEIGENGKFPLTAKGYVYQIEEDCFRYKGDDWLSTGRINFSALKKLILKNLNRKESEFEILEFDSSHAWYRQSYYMPLIKYFFKESGQYKKSVSTSSEELKKYILIIDEINRANLPSVLGELIYALEYRDHPVESMYELEGEGKSIILPSNLYIIGTMNTADRSVGHIDYAIRRRFAFVDIVPNDKVIEVVIKDDALMILAKNLFNKVADLFYEKSVDTNPKPIFLTTDFKAKEVQLGHSYFLADTEEELKMKLEYEIKPILREYVKDGILLENAGKIIDELSV